MNTIAKGMLYTVAAASMSFISMGAVEAAGNGKGGGSFHGGNTMHPTGQGNASRLSATQFNSSSFGDHSKVRIPNDKRVQTPAYKPGKPVPPEWKLGNTQLQNFKQSAAKSGFAAGEPNPSAPGGFKLPQTGGYGKGSSSWMGSQFGNRGSFEHGPNSKWINGRGYGSYGHNDFRRPYRWDCGFGRHGCWNYPGWGFGCYPYQSCSGFSGGFGLGCQSSSVFCPQAACCPEMVMAEPIMPEFAPSLEMTETMAVRKTVETPIGEAGFITGSALK
jgi:hypothetical protein